MTSAYPDFIYYLRPISLFVGFPILISGLIGNCLCITVFLSLKTFRNHACSFYLMCTCFFNVGHLLTGFLTRLMVNAFYIDWTTTSQFYCKFRISLLQFCILGSLSSLSLATWDQYISTCNKQSWKKFSTLKIAHRLLIVISIIWFLHGIPFFVTMNIESGTCIIINNVLNDYFRRFFQPVLWMLLPISLMVIFSVLSVQNIRMVNQQTIPGIGRRELDRQLTKMLLTQILFVSIATVPFITHYTYVANTTFSSANAIFEQQFIAALLNIVWQTGYSASFYIYYWCSPRFRRQFYHVFFKVHLQRCQRIFCPPNEITPNDVTPHDIYIQQQESS